MEPRRLPHPEPDDPLDESAGVAPADAVDAAPGPAPERPSDWGSLLADLSRPRESGPQLRIHDRTHLELAVDYDLADGKGEAEWHWEAYFFAPESLRLDSQTYGKQDVYEDLQSYVRFAVPDASFAALAGEPIERARSGKLRP